MTFLWQVLAPAVFGHGGWEVRANRLANGRSVVAGSGFQGEVCTGGTDTVLPSIPVADGRRVWYSELTSDCYLNTASVVRFDARRRHGTAGIVPGDVTQFAKDGDALYALVAPRPQGHDPLTCATPGAPCTVQRLDPPALTKVVRRPRLPVLDF